MYKRRRKSLSLLVQMGYVTSVTWQNRKMDFAPFAWIKVSFFFRRRTIWKDFWRTRKCNQSIRRTRGKAIKVSNADLERQSKHPKDIYKKAIKISKLHAESQAKCPRACAKAIKVSDMQKWRQSRCLMHTQLRKAIKISGAHGERQSWYPQRWSMN